MLKWSFFGIFILVMVSGLALAAPARAQDIRQCGAPVSGEIPVNAVPLCDIYSRQIAFREERKKLHDQLQQRRRNFVTPQLAALKTYRESMKTLNERRSAETGTQEAEAPVSFFVLDDSGNTSP